MQVTPGLRASTPGIVSRQLRYDGILYV